MDNNGLADHGDDVGAIEILENAIQLAPRDYDVNLLLGIDLLRVGRLREAVAPLQLAAQIGFRSRGTAGLSRISFHGRS